MGMTTNGAIKWMQEEKASFERAPDLNGCPMTAVWQEAIDVYDMAISALRAQQDQYPDAGKMMPRWISVKDRMPERTMPPHDVLVYHDLKCGMFIDRAWYSHDKNKWMNVLGINLKVTHWIPLPEPPEEIVHGKP